MAKTGEPFTVFYAWQSDTAQTHCRQLIRDALDSVADKLNADLEIPYRVTIDQDTQNVPGLCDIPATLLGKIERADAFVADLTYIATSRRDKHCSNPNVLFELGFAFHAIGWERLICVMNEVHGPVAKQIFDLGHRRHPIAFKSPDKPATRRQVIDGLAIDIESALRDIIAWGPRSVASDSALRHETERASADTLARSRIDSHGDHLSASAVAEFGLCPIGYQARRWNSTRELEGIMSQVAIRSGSHEFPPQQRGTADTQWGIFNDTYGSAWALTYAGQFWIRCPIAAGYESPKLPDYYFQMFLEKPSGETFPAGTWISVVPLFRAFFDALAFSRSLASRYSDHERMEVSFNAAGISGKWLGFYSQGLLDDPNGPCIVSDFSRRVEVTPALLREQWQSIAATWATEFCGLFSRNGMRVQQSTVSNWFGRFARNEVW
jgi:hypothetical protein